MSKYISYIILLILTSVVPSLGKNTNPFTNKELNDENLISCMEYYGIDNTKWVLAQAKLETGHYKSNLCRNGNNLFGLYNSRKGSFFKFNHWSLSVKAYKDFIQREGRYDKDKYTEQNYHKYLTKIGYAEDPNYIERLRVIMKREEKGKNNDTRTITRSNNKSQRPKQQLNSRISHKKKSTVHSSRKNKHPHNTKTGKQQPKKYNLRSLPEQHRKR